MKRRKQIKGMKIGSTKVTYRKIRKEKRKVYVTRVKRRKYRVRLLNPRPSAFSKKMGRYNYGRSYKLDKAFPYKNKKEAWEVRGKLF